MTPEYHQVSETAKIEWQELLRFFANGTAIYVAQDLDLVEVAWQMSQDNKPKIEQWMQVGQVDKVTDAQAKTWLDNDVIMWAVVVKPWVLVQEVKE